MTLLDTTSVRSATVSTLERTVVAKVTEPAFTGIADKFPDLWRRMALALAIRLRERSKFHKSPRTQPAVFIGSSSEGLPIAESIAKCLRRFPCVPKLWSNGVFECSEISLESLVRATAESDFSVLVLTSDDTTRSRGKDKPSPRDNVIFELGLFMGALGRTRTYIVAAVKGNLKIPTDLLGLTVLFVRPQRGVALNRRLQPTIRQLRNMIRKHGPI
jgi:predicted nucleotide-binding protein